MKILLAVDGSRYTKKMLAYLATHEELFSPSNDFTLLTLQPSLSMKVRAAVGKEVVDKYYSETAEKVLGPTSKFLFRHKINAKSEWKVGHIGNGISNFADAGKFDLVVMGSHGNGSIANLVMGSVATQVLATCSVPVLLVR